MSKAKFFVRVAAAITMATGPLMTAPAPANAGPHGVVDRFLRSIDPNKGDQNNRSRQDYNYPQYNGYPQDYGYPQNDLSYAGDVEYCSDNYGRTQYCPPRPGCIIARHNPYSYNPVYLCP